LAHAIKHGASIGLFPEGTTTDGTHVAHFHAAMLQPAIDSGAAVYPVGLRYLDQNRQHSIRASFTGETTLVDSLWNILCGHKFFATATFVPFDSKRYTDRKSLAQATREVIANHLHQPVAIPDNNVVAPLKTGHESPPTSYGLLLDPLAHPHRD
jgi:1-acyl-sn-glycerol-3-phosphate acyltransferase